ncbi:MAG: protease inhibitor I42 family protein [Alphaproteobacteria bacterium]|nr:protease inhibitor I42 family protein [Alphaproteobacteria bacterium]
MKKYLVLAAMLLAACGEKEAAKDAAVAANDTPAAVEESAEAGNSVINLSINDNRMEVEARVGQEVVLSLDANATTGYKWSFVTYVADEQAVEELEDTYVADEAPEGMVGVGGKAVYKLKLLKAGDVYVTANYSRDEGLASKEDQEDDFSVKLAVK